MTSRSILANQISTWLSQEEYVGEVKLHAGTSLQEVSNEFCFVGRVLVEDDVRYRGG
jgi:hypothetical protein